jgi:hypothetical protein
MHIEYIGHILFLDLLLIKNLNPSNKHNDNNKIKYNLFIIINIYTYIRNVKINENK